MLRKLTGYLSGLSTENTINELLQKVIKCITHLKALSNTYLEDLEDNINVLSNYSDISILNQIKSKILNE